MIHSFLIVGGTKKKRKQAASTKLRRSAGATASEHAASGSERVDAGRGEPDQTTKAKFDITTLEPEEDKQVITIDQIRNLQHQLSLRPYAAKFKTGIILEAQRMTAEAQNALLKTLEEPPAHSVLILTAPSTKNLLPTITSRCQTIRLRPEIDLEVESEEHQRAVEEFLRLLQSGRGERLAWAEENKPSLNSQLSTLNLLEVWISVLRDLLLTNSDHQELVLNSAVNNLTIQQFNNSVKSIHILTEALERTIETKNLIARTNVSPRLALEVLLLDLPNF